MPSSLISAMSQQQQQPLRQQQQQPVGAVPFAQQGSQVRPDIPAFNPKFPSAPVIWPVGSREAVAAAQGGHLEWIS